MSGGGTKHVSFYPNLDFMKQCMTHSYWPLPKTRTHTYMHAIIIYKLFDYHLKYICYCKKIILLIIVNNIIAIN